MKYSVVTDTRGIVLLVEKDRAAGRRVAVRLTRATGVDHFVVTGDFTRRPRYGERITRSIARKKKK